MARRSLLFSPGDRPEMLRKAPRTGADVITFDLEDAVAPGRVEAAREAVAGVLSDPEFDPDCEVRVRVNADPEIAADDLAALPAGDPPDGLLAPKVTAGADVADLAELARERGFDLPVMALCESAAGVLHAEGIAAAAPTDALALGAEDLAADVGATRTPEGTEMSYAREHVMLAAAAAGVDAIDAVYTDLDDEAGLREAAAIASEFGYDGKMCIHPDQVPVVNAAFTPDDDRVRWARRVLEAAAAADRDERGVFRVDGEMVDAPLIAQAERVLERARAAGALDEG